jgi:hypothetical protein
MKRTISLLAVATIAAAWMLSPSAGAAPKKLKVVLEDVEEDANFVNDQGTGDGSFGDVGGASASEFADIVEVGFANDKKNLYVHILTRSTGIPASAEGFRVRVNPQAGSVYCLNFEIFFPGAAHPTLMAPLAHLRDFCAGDQVTEAKVELSNFGGWLITVPRKAHEAFGKGKKLTATQAQTYLWSGAYPVGVAGPYLDTTKVGGDYKLVK